MHVCERVGLIDVRLCLCTCVHACVILSGHAYAVWTASLCLSLQSLGFALDQKDITSASPSP